MNNNVSVVVPYRPDGGPRDAAWEWCLRQWQRDHPQWPVHTGPGPDGPWCKAAAITQAARDVPDGIVVVADADVWCTGVTAAVDRVRDGIMSSAARRDRDRAGIVSWAVPHRHVYRLTRRATEGVLDGRPVVDDVEEDPYHGHDGGGIVVLPVSVLRDTPPDPRFHGWGQEDDAWALALSTLHGPRWRGVAQLHHLWHPVPPRLDRAWGSMESRALYRRYERAASSGPAAMRALVSEARELLAVP